MRSLVHEADAVGAAVSLSGGAVWAVGDSSVGAVGAGSSISAGAVGAGAEEGYIISGASVLMVSVGVFSSAALEHLLPGHGQ